MRRILIDRTRAEKRLKRGKAKRQIELAAIEVALDTPVEEMIALDEALRDLTAECPDSVSLPFDTIYRDRDCCDDAFSDPGNAMRKGESPLG